MQVRELSDLMGMLFEAEQAKLRPILEREAELRRDIAQLDQQKATNRDLPAEHYEPMRPIGADLQWQAWLGRTRSELNRRLALCLAQKEHYIATLRRAHGRKIAADQIATHAADQQRVAGHKSELEWIESLSLNRHFMQK